MAQKQQETTPSEPAESEEIEELPKAKKKPDMKKLDAFLDEVDELLEEDTVAETIAKAEFKEKLRSIQFVTPRSSEVPVTLAVTGMITCRFRCENCTCGR